MSNQNHASGFNFIGGSKYINDCVCDECDVIGICLPVADGVYCADCYQAAQDALTDEMDEAFADNDDCEFYDSDAWEDSIDAESRELAYEQDDPRDYYQEMMDYEPSDERDTIFDFCDDYPEFDY